jgi:hypothetical protein
MKNYQKGNTTLLIIIVAFLIIGTGYYFYHNSQSGSAVNTYIDPSGKYSYEYPLYWKKINKGEGFTNASESEMFEQFNVIVFDKSTTFTPSSSNLINSKDSMVGGEKAKEYIYNNPLNIVSGKNAGTIINEQKIDFFVTHNGYQYELNYQVQSNYYSQHPDTIQNLVNSFKFI